MWHYTGFGGYDIEIDNTFEEACYRTDNFSETNCIPGPSGQRPIPIYDEEGWWCVTPFWYKSNLPWLAVIYIFLKRSPEQGGYGGYKILPASASWKAAAVNTRRYAYDVNGAEDGRTVDVRREIIMGFNTEWGMDWTRSPEFMVAVDEDADVYRNSVLGCEYQVLSTSYAGKARRR